MKIVFCINDFREKNFRLQPWLNFFRIGEIFAGQGHRVFILTDCPVPERPVSGIRFLSVKSLRANNSNQLLDILNGISPDIIVFSVTPLSLATSGWLGKIRNALIFAFLSYPFYNFKELVKALPRLNSYDRWAYGRHLMVPGRIWRYQLARHYSGAICQSSRTGLRFLHKGKSIVPVHCIAPGIDKSVWFPARKDKEHKDKTVFLYTGSPKRIRGFELILDAFSDLPHEDVTLRILARGADQDAVEKIGRRLEDKGISHKTDVVGGWQSMNQMQAEIRAADVVLLPFVLVPSELPVTVMEVIACGTPVIVSDIDGLPEAAGDCGIVVPQADAKGLAGAMRELHENKRMAAELRSNCLSGYQTMVSWENMAEKWMDAFRKASET